MAPAGGRVLRTQWYCAPLSAEWQKRRYPSYISRVCIIEAGLASPRRGHYAYVWRIGFFVDIYHHFAPRCS